MTQPSPPETLALQGRILLLTEDASLIQLQLAGENVAHDSGAALMHDISTDEISPAWACYYFDETIGRYCLVGLRGGVVGVDAIRRGGFQVIVSGRSKGCGSSREQAPLAELAAGVQLVVAESLEKIYEQNAQNIGLLTTTDFGVLDRLAQGERVPIEALTAGLDAVSASIVQRGGLFKLARARLAGEVTLPPILTAPRPMTSFEKIVAAHAVVDARGEVIGVPAVAPGDSLFVRCDVRFSHEYVTPMADALLRGMLGEEVELAEPDSITLFRDHLTFLPNVMAEEHVRMGLDERAAELASAQERFARRHGLRLWGEVRHGEQVVGSEAICHNKILEQIALPGQVVVGTDSHTCTAGALGCVAFGVGATDMAAAWITRDVRARVPETVLVHLRGALPVGVAAKDIMLHLLATEYVRLGGVIGKVLQFAGEGVTGLGLDERATLTNMAVEAGAFTGLVEADERVVMALARARRVAPEQVRRHVVRGDADARYAATLEIDLAQVVPMVATPGSPRNGIPVRALDAWHGGQVRIDIAYGGSCTGGKCQDMDMYAEVLGCALRTGRRVADGVALYIQYGSQRTREYAIARGYAEIFDQVGARVLEPACGACILAGPGISRSADQVTVSAVNRNFPGRSGPGQVFLASPYVVAASAIAGFIVEPELD